MKKITTCLIITMLLACSFIVSRSFGQAKADIITMKNGEKRTGKVTSVSGTVVKFSYSNETLEYEIPKTDINKIEFSSGRTETFGQPPAATEAKSEAPATGNSSAEERKNKIAVLPFEIETNDQSLATPSMSKEVQASCISALRSQSPFQSIQDPMITNNILAKKNLTANDLSTHTPKEWAELLGVEFVIIGSYSIQNKGTSTYGSGSTTSNKKNNDDKSKETSYGSSNSYTTTNYNTHVNVGIYNDHGEQIFSDSRAPAFGGVDSYKGALKVLIKRSPFSKK